MVIFGWYVLGAMLMFMGGFLFHWAFFARGNYADYEAQVNSYRRVVRKLEASDAPTVAVYRAPRSVPLPLAQSDRDLLG
jgi:hypothetical protein